MNGHSSIVKTLIEHGADVSVKNEEDVSPLDLSCRKGYFEISKNIIACQEAAQSNDDDLILDVTNEYPLHVACFEGAHEVVKLLLLNGAMIHKLNKENKNCLDIAIGRGHKEVIRVLLNDENWFKLIRISSEDRTDTETMDKSDDKDLDSSLVVKSSKVIENPQLVALSDAKMWEMLKIVLDKSLTIDEFNRETRIDFRIIDPPLKNISQHPLMLIACSGQENLLQHEVIRTLLHLKWRFIPRMVFYFNIIFYLMFLILFSLFTIELSEITLMYKQSKFNATSTNIHIRERVNLTLNFQVFSVNGTENQNFFLNIFIQII